MINGLTLIIHANERWLKTMPRLVRSSAAWQVRRDAANSSCTAKFASPSCADGL